MLVKMASPSEKSESAPANKLETMKKAIHDFLYEENSFTYVFSLAEKYTKVSREYLFFGRYAGAQILGEVDEPWLPAVCLALWPVVSCRVGGCSVRVSGYWFWSRAGREPPWVCLPCIQVVSGRAEDEVSAITRNKKAVDP